MEKLTIDWLKMLPEPYRTEALANLNPQYSNHRIYTNSACDAIQYGFGWGGTPQKYNYWLNFRNKLERNEIKLTEPFEPKPGDLVKVKRNSYEWITMKYVGMFGNKILATHGWANLGGHLLLVYDEMKPIPEEPKITTLTLKEIADKLNIPVDQLRIKD